MSPRTKEILDELKEWCDQEQGRDALVGSVIEARSQVVTNWFAGEEEPTPEQIILIQEFLSKQKNWKKSE
jgi:hypothetical protein